MSFDLHTHSNVSDGTEPPSQVIAAAVRAGLRGIALTDHDTTAGWDEAISAAAKTDLVLIPGMEMTAKTDDGVSVHMLSYLHDPHHPALAEAIGLARGGRLERAQRMCELLAEDFPITWELVAEQVSPDATVGRPHLADALVAAGVVTDRSEAFRRFLHGRSKYYLPTENIGPVQAIELIREAGGVSVIAHAMASTRGRTVTLDQLGQMIDAGLDGVEVRHRDNTAEGQQVLQRLAQSHDLIVTGSSDYHGTGKPNPIGENTTDTTMVERILEQATGTPAYGQLPVGGS